MTTSTLQVINEMAMETVLHNIDRCTKNFVTYFNPHEGRWTRFPWDLDSVFATDRDLGRPLEPLRSEAALGIPLLLVGIKDVWPPSGS